MATTTKAGNDTTTSASSEPGAGLGESSSVGPVGHPQLQQAAGTGKPGRQVSGQRGNSAARSPVASSKKGRRRRTRVATAAGSGNGRGRETPGGAEQEASTGARGTGRQNANGHPGTPTGRSSGGSSLEAIVAGLQQSIEFLSRTLLEKVARSREAELEALGRASGLQVAVETLRQENQSLRNMNDRLFERSIGAPVSLPSTYQPMGPVMSAVPEYHSLPNVVHGVPAGSPRAPMHIPAGSAFDPALPPVGVAPARPQAQYAGTGVGEQDFFTDMGDDAARAHGVSTDDETGALVGGPSLPPPPQNRTQ